MEYLIILFRIITIMLLLLFSTLFITGKRPIGELPVFDFLSLIIVGAIVGADIADPNIEHLPTAFAVIVLALLQRLISFLMIKYRKINKLLTFEPTIVITNGKLIQKNIKKINYTIEEILMLLRNKEIFDISQLEYAIVESNGKISIMRKTEYEQATKKDLKIESIEKDIPIVVILERQIIKKSLNYIDVSEDELRSILQSNGYEDYSNLFLVTLSKNKTIGISPYDVQEKIEFL